MHIVPDSDRKREEKDCHQIPQAGAVRDGASK